MSIASMPILGGYPTMFIQVILELSITPCVASVLYVRVRHNNVSSVTSRAQRQRDMFIQILMPYRNI